MSGKALFLILVFRVFGRCLLQSQSYLLLGSEDLGQDGGNVGHVLHEFTVKDTDRAFVFQVQGRRGFEV